MSKKTLRDLSDTAIRGKRVVVRADFNVPLENGRVTDDNRIRATVPTIQYLIERDAAVILMSHLGRPKGKWKEELSLRPVAKRLGELLDSDVHFVEDVVGPDAHSAIAALPWGEVLLLENTRFLPGEETNDPKLSEGLAGLGDVYVNDAFGAAHRAHSSTCGVAEAMGAEGRPSVAGLLMEKEIRFLRVALGDPDHPFVSILGGAKISGKIDVIENLLPKLDRLLIGGAMANTFLRALGLETGQSLVEEDRVDLARELLETAEDKLVLPVDCVVAAEAEPGAVHRVLDRDNVPAEGRILDIGPKTVATFREIIEGAATVVWNGPMGMFEIEEFSQGTVGVARAVADATERGATTIVGGGDTAAAVDEAGVTSRITHVSTGGGASLDFLEGKSLPGIEVLDERTDEAT